MKYNATPFVLTIFVIALAIAIPLLLQPYLASLGQTGDFLNLLNVGINIWTASFLIRSFHAQNATNNLMIQQALIEFRFAELKRVMDIISKITFTNNNNHYLAVNAFMMFCKTTNVDAHQPDKTRLSTIETRLNTTDFLSTIMAVCVMFINQKETAQEIINHQYRKALDNKIETTRIAIFRPMTRALLDLLRIRTLPDQTIDESNVLEFIDKGTYPNLFNLVKLLGRCGEEVAK